MALSSKCRPWPRSNWEDASPLMNEKSWSIESLCGPSMGQSPSGMLANVSSNIEILLSGACRSGPSCISCRCYFWEETFHTWFIPFQGNVAAAHSLQQDRKTSDNTSHQWQSTWEVGVSVLDGVWKKAAEEAPCTPHSPPVLSLWQLIAHPNILY